MKGRGRNELCHCGTGKKYKHCCLSLDEEADSRHQLARSARTLANKNMALLEATEDIFNLSRSWSAAKNGMSDARISAFYRFVASLWPQGTETEIILPKPDDGLRALYLGENEPELMLENVFRFSLYADEILLVNPFPNPDTLAEEYNPIVHPGEWRIQTLRTVYQLKMLMPWVKSGLVILIPDPGELDRQLRMKTWDLAAERLKGFPVTPADIEPSMIRNRARRAFLLGPRSYYERIVRTTSPELSEAEVEEVLDEIERDRLEDPLLPNGTLDRMPEQMMVANMGTNLETGMYICQATGAFPYTNVKYRWDEILRANESLDATAKVWSPLTHAFQQLKFKFLNNVDSQFACAIREEGRLESFRSYLRKLWRTVGGQPDVSKSEAVARDFRDELSQAYAQAQAEWDAIDRELLKWAVPTLGTAAVATGLFSPLIGSGLAVAGVGELVQSHLKRREFRKKVPMSVFIDLDKK